MGDAKRKADMAMISVLIPERGRPRMLKRLIDSLIATADGDRRYEILVSVDDDDETWTDQPPHEPWSAARPVTWYHGPRAVTLGEKLNKLAAEARGDILWFIANDYVMETVGWPGKFRQAVTKLPNGIGVPYVHDDLHPDHTAFPIITRKMMTETGFMFPPWFGIGWFIDTWMDELGILMGIRFEVDVNVRAPEGRGTTHGIRDITFWATFFNELRPYRVRDAFGLLKIAYGETSPGYESAQRNMRQREALCVSRTGHLTSPEFAAIWEARVESEPPESYAQVKTYAENMLTNMRKGRRKPVRVGVAVPSGRTWEATTANCIAALSAHSGAAGIDMFFCNVQTSQITHGRNTTVKMALEQRCDWLMWLDSDMRVSPDVLLRLLDHDKSIVGATYNKRVARPDGTYETLGRLMGPQPEALNDGLHEALFLPGGIMLVNMEVYRKLKWPWYAEAYRWDGDDGLDRFRALLKDYFDEQPPDDVLNGLEATAFGAWIKDNYVVGDGPMMSEDLFFCRKARRAGFKIWCDLKVTGESAHIGQTEITCVLPANTIRIAAE